MKNIFDVFKRDKEPDDYFGDNKSDINKTSYGEQKKPKTVKEKKTDSDESLDVIDLKKDDTIGKKKSFLGKGKTQSSWVYPRIIKKKLTIVLLENTKKSLEAKNIILKIIHRLLSTDLICIITYGSTIKVEKVVKVSDFADEKLLNIDDMNDNACLYDALEILNKVVTIALKKIQDDDFGINRYKIESIDVIGIGSGLDVGSKMNREEAIKCFDNILSKKDVETKYFCFSEDTFKEVASIGFRSIGAFPTKKV